MGFSREAVEELSSLHAEPDWLRARRLESFELYERIPLPDTKREEDWRQVDLKPLKLESFGALERPNGVRPYTAVRVEDSAGLLRLGGSEVSRKLDPELERKGVIFTSLPLAAASQPELVERHLFSAVKPDRDKFAALHAALFTGGTFLYVPEGVQIDLPLVSQYSTAGAGTASLPHTLIVAGRGSRFQYMDEFQGAEGELASLVSGSAEVFLEDGAAVTYVGLQRWGSRAWQFANQRFHLGRDAHLSMVDIGLGGRFARLRVEVMLEGAGSRAELKGVFFGSGEQAFDFRTLQDHLAPHTQSDLLFKGALRDSARSVYVGVVRVEKNARASSSNQANRNLLLSEKARASSEPILEIENNDIIRCSHGATVGPVDPEHMFYLESRGIPRPVAQRMLVQGFLGEIIDRIPAGHAREVVEQELAARIG
jgi:Fe-S cluster assembly protein SufD